MNTKLNNEGVTCWWLTLSEGRGGLEVAAEMAGSSPTASSASTSHPRSTGSSSSWDGREGSSPCCVIWGGWGGGAAGAKCGGYGVGAVASG